MPLFGFGESKDPEELLAEQKYEKAVEGFRDRLEENPEDLKTRLRLADALSYVDEEEAIEEYSNVAETYAQKGFLLKAIATNKKIIRLDPERDETHEKIHELEQKRALQEDMIEQPPEPEEAVPEQEESSSYEQARTPLFSDLPVDQFKEVARNLTHHTYESGESIVEEGEKDDSMYVIVEGRVVVETVDTTDDTLELTTLSAGDFFGEVSLLTGKPRTATLTAVEETQLLELKTEDFEEIASEFPGIKETIKEFYEERADDTVEAMLERMKEKEKNGD